VFKKIALILTAVLLIGSTVCFSAPQKVKITFWDENAGPSRTPYLQELIKKFNQANPNIEVEYVGLPWSSSKQKIDVAIAANNTPDCSGVSTNWVSEFALNKSIIPLDRYFNKLKDHKEYAPVHIKAVRDLVPDKKLYLLPNSFNANLLWYRPDWFKEAGLNAPKTWDEFFNVITKMTNKDKKLIIEIEKKSFLTYKKV
jgi:multiple sugar transport system substrate-binding protein